MPTAFIENEAKKHGISVVDAEKKWSEAKEAAKKAGDGSNYAVVTTIFKRMLGEKGSVIARVLNRLRVTSQIDFRKTKNTIERILDGKFGHPAMKNGYLTECIYKGYRYETTISDVITDLTVFLLRDGFEIETKNALSATFKNIHTLDKVSFHVQKTADGTRFEVCIWSEL